MKIAVSFLKSKDSIDKTITKIDNSIADYIHVDYMDGLFVPEKTISITEVLKPLSNTTKPLSVHMMCKNPLRYLDNFAYLNTLVYTIHLEVIKSLKDLEEIKLRGLKCGLAINPDTPLERLEPYLELVDDILIMSVYPGKGGQEFIPDALARINQLNELRYQNKYHYTISVDGGINADTALSCYLAGVDTIISGSYVCMSDQIDARIKELEQ